MSRVVFKNKNTNHEYSFNNGVCFIQDKKFAKELVKPNYKNSESPVVIKSLNDLSVADVIQIKINLENTGCFWANFEKSLLNEEKREKLLKELRNLKSEEETTKSSQTKKAIKIVKILEKYAPIYVVFNNFDSTKITLNYFNMQELSIPVLFLPQHKKLLLNLEPKHVFKKPLKQKEKKEKKVYAPIELFCMDYFFIFLFSLFCALASVTAVFEIMNKQGIGVFLIILVIAFIVTEAIAMTLTIYNKGKEKNPYLRYYLSIFILVGVVFGVVAGYFISKNLLKTEIENFNYNKVVLISTLISSFSLLSSIGTSIFINKIITRIKKRKENQ